ncbi:Vang-like protein 2 [Xyrichtys novacula]|uniref:Vang-like protein 2 n=1 Tax=Xyrichtys novacula TaxID=13765 RepID=A0AAV1F2L5_XYRNO|nr:Vang-like protein 2 [Xyrichtys novacula]
MGQLLDLRQESLPVSQYAINFRILVASSGFGDTALPAIFRKGLTGEIKDELAVWEESSSLNELIELSIRIDNRLRKRRRERRADQTRRSPASSVCSPGDYASWPDVSPHLAPEHHSPPPDESMQLGRSRLTPAERQWRMREKLCLYCGCGGHYLATCTEMPKRQGSPVGRGALVSRISSSSSSQIRVQGMLHETHLSHELQVLIDSRG